MNDYIYETILLGYTEPYKTYYEYEGNHITEIKYKHNNYNAEYKEWYKNGEVILKIVEGTIINGKIEGLWLVYNTEGILIEQCFYKNGLLEGEYKEWFDNGQPMIHTFYNEDKLDGEYIEWNEEGELIVKGIYKKGSLVGVYKEWKY